MTMDDDDDLVSLADVAEMVRVTRPAVSNWRRRYKDFPKPVEETGATSLFRLGAIRAWLTKYNKRFDDRSVYQLVWSALSPERSVVLPEDAAQGGMVLLAYLEVARRLSPQLSTRLQEALAAEDEATLPEVIAELNRLAPRSDTPGGTFPAGLTAAWPQASRPFLRKLFDLAVQHGTSETFDALIAALGRGSRGEGYHTTPDGITGLIMALARPVSGVVIDLACGYGTLLVEASKAASSQLTLIGQDLNSGACDVARLRMFVHGLSAEISQGDSLRPKSPFVPAASIETTAADLILADPAPAVSWQSELADRRNAPHGTSPNAPLDAEWLPNSFARLKPGGTAVLVLGHGATFRGGPEGEIRRRLIESRCVRVVVALPPELYPSSSTPASLWILTKESRWVTPLPDNRTLLVDASRLGTRRGKTRTELQVSDIEAITACVDSWDALGKVTADSGVRAVAVSVDRLLVASSNLNPARWVEDPTADPAQLLRRIDAAQDEARAASSALYDVDLTVPMLELQPPAPSPVDRTTVKLTDLARFVRPRRIDPDLIGTGTTPLVRAHDIGPDLTITPSGLVDADLAADRIDLTQPGDIVVTADGARPSAAVDLRGGSAVGAPLQIVRPRPGAIPSVVLAALIGGVASRYATDSSATHVNLAAFEVPVPDSETARVLGGALLELGKQRRQAMTVVNAVDDLRAGLVDALGSPDIRLALPFDDNPGEWLAPGAEP